jgi:hypothetical protein
LGVVFDCGLSELFVAAQLRLLRASVSSRVWTAATNGVLPAAPRPGLPGRSPPI